MGDYFKSNFAKLSFTFQSIYLGMSPWRCPGAFAMVPLVEHHDGVYHIEGGLSEINSVIASVIKKDGSEIFYNSKVKQIILENKKAIGVELENGEKHLADEVIVNADFSYMVRNLIDKNITKKFKRWSPKKLNKKNYSCSIFMIYLGIKKRLDLDHHTIVFAKNYRKNVNDIFDYRLTDDDFSFYVRDTSKVDPGLAPKDKTALYILVPVPNNRSKIDWEKEKQKIRDKTFLLIEERLGKEILDSDIEVEKIITPLDWEKDYNVDLGAVFNLGHNLNQMLWFRPHNKFEELDNLYLVGGGTHPGSGLPTIYQSGKIVAELIKQKYS
jgi:phytoene desaturase